MAAGGLNHEIIRHTSSASDFLKDHQNKELLPRAAANTANIAA